MKSSYQILKITTVCIVVILLSSLDEIKPRVLIIGDSISIGYTPFVQEMLKESAVVNRPMKEDLKPENCEGTIYGVQHVERWIGDVEWDLIHFNFGLHDLKHVDPETGKPSPDPNHPVQAELDVYEENLREIVKLLEATKAKLIFANTTPYPDTAVKPLRDPGMSAVYNEVALEIMKENNIIVNDLYAFVLPRMEELQRPHNVHFTKKGSEALGKKVAEAIQHNLKN